MIAKREKGHCALFLFVKKGLLLAAALGILLCSGCGNSSVSSLQWRFPLHLPAGSEPVWTKPYYEGLNDKQKEAYREIYQLSDRLGTETISLGNKLSAGEVLEVLEAYYKDTPEHFWIVEGMETFWMEGDNAFLELRYLFADEASRSRAVDQMEAVLDRALASLRSNMDDFTKELTLHDWLIKQCVYDRAAYEAVLEERPIQGMEASFSAWGALVEGKAACAGYARAMQLLLGAAGIPCSYLSGTGIDPDTGRSFTHAWNVVTIEGKSYHLDSTWNDQGTWSVQDGQYRFSGEGEHYISHRYFNQTDRQMALDHQDFAFQGCNSTDANYFVRQGLMVSRLDEAEQAALVERLTRIGMEQEQPLLELWAPEEVQTLFDKLVHPEDGMLYQCLKAANQQMRKKVFQEGQAVAWYQEESGIITIRALYEEEE